MKHPILLTLIFILSGFFSLAQEKPQAVPGNIIVQVSDKHVEDVIAANRFLNGTPTGLKLGRLLSAPMAAYLLEFDPLVDHKQMLRQIWDHPDVMSVQLNHYIKNRETTPNDPQFDQQWWHVNDGSNGGTADADIDSDEAWDITTGGVTALGDTIVVCVVDDGGDLDHPDLMANNWVNHHEIPGNGIDDDGNGYIDDYLGWNPVGNDDDVDGGSHGVSVAGMIGAVGDNGTGVSGVNWNVKIMNMTYGSIGSGTNPNEANVIEAYTYPLVMRRLYEETNGAQGAFVVATNSSWGIDNANPANAPIWCAFYDTLGASGILSAGATANNNVNIDQVGDLPTACSSEYMVSVTATNNSDVRTFSGYGATTVDLGAPGEAVRTTAAGGQYTTTQGTSFATPATAGAIALMYSAPCASLAAIAHSDPALAAEMVRDAIFNGVDPVSNLTNECVTGGRLNLKGALDEVLNNCSEGDCLPPFSLVAANVTDTSANVSFGSLADIDTFDIEYGMIGGEDSLLTDLTENSLTINGLQACSDYWLLARSVCDGEASEWSDTLFISTDGCCLPPALLEMVEVTDTTVSLTWSSVLAAEEYLLQWREVETSDWEESTSEMEESVLDGLEPCTEYEFRVATTCVSGTTGFTDVITVTTFGCGACTDFTFCPSEGRIDFEWIDQVVIGDLDNTSGQSATGYSDFTDMTVELRRGATYDVALTPDYDGQSFTEHFRIWIDLSQNGVFSVPELLFDDEDGTTTTVTGTITIPTSAPLGSARMRVSMAWGSQFGGNYPHGPCETEQDGEVEDYCVTILEEEEDTTTVFPGIEETNGQFGMEVFPVPASDELNIRFEQPLTGQAVLRMFDLSGREVLEQPVSSSRAALNVSSASQGIYQLIATDDDGTLIGRARVVIQ